MAKLYNLTRMSTATTGTGTMTLGAAVPGYLTFALAGIQNGDWITYAIADGVNREIGRGIYSSTGPTLTRQTVLASTNSNNPISLSGSAQVMIAAAAEDFAVIGAPQGRLTLAANTPVMVSNVSGANTLYYTAFKGNRVPIWNGAKWSLEGFPSDLTNLTTDAVNNPAACVASSAYDLFVWLKNGVLTLTRGPVWSSLTARAMTLARLNGILTNSAAITNGPPANQGTFVGSIATDGSATLDVQFGGTGSGGVPGYFCLSNYWNRVRQLVQSLDNGGAYTLASTTWRPWRNSINNAHYMMFCTTEEANVQLVATMHTISPGASGSLYAIGLGLDSTTVPVAVNYHQVETNNTINWSHLSKYDWNCGGGWHVAYGLEIGCSPAPTLQADATGYLQATFYW